MTQKFPCTECGTLILQSTFIKYLGQCCPCKGDLYVSKYDHPNDKELNRLFKYGKLLLQGGDFNKDCYVEQDRKAAVTFLGKLALHNHPESIATLELLRRTLTSKQQDQELFKEFYMIDEKIRAMKEQERDDMFKELMAFKNNSSGPKNFLLSVTGGVATFFITRSFLGEGISGAGTIGLSIVAIVTMFLIIIKT